MIIKKDRMGALLGTLAQHKTVFVPALIDGVSKFAPYREGLDVRFDLHNTKLPPKDLLFPQTQKMYRYGETAEGGHYVEQFDESSERVLFGVRPCDMRSINLLDDVFLTKGFVDEFYEAQRKKLLTVCITCAAPAETCFCESMGLSPNEAPDADILLKSCEDCYKVTAQTQKGEAALADWRDFLEDTQAQVLPGKTSLRLNFEGVPQKLSRMYEDPIWDEISTKCLNCGTCTFVCPTCYCFDISQENKMKEGVRFRCWDSCMFSEYTAMAGWHNPRPTKKERVRNRFMHKLCFFEERYGKTLCVGCGRCVECCPVALDITRLIDDIGASDA
ncbi:MAG: 4Fe-4S dicluster domain-containing protein [Coriobacteriales bacterium]|nr:4Fe-4S dicluster domain-containing protein [Coriobacteriales bacterium]